MDGLLRLDLQMFGEVDGASGVDEAVASGVDGADGEVDFASFWDDEDLGEDAGEGGVAALDDGLPEGREPGADGSGAVFDGEVARRELEREAFSRAQSEKDRFVADLYGGQVNPYSGRVIDSEAELAGYRAAYERDREQQQLAGAGIDRGLIERMIEDSPIVREARQMVEHERMRAGTELLAKQVGAIGGLDPSIKCFEDLTKMAHFAAFDDLVRNKGYGLVDAFKLANFEELAARKAEAGKQHLLNNQASKGHLRSLGGNGSGSGDVVVVPSDVREMYREINPGISDGEILSHYKQSLKG